MTRRCFVWKRRNKIKAKKRADREKKEKKKKCKLVQGGNGMNLNEERSCQKLLDVLEALELTETNRKLAEEYFALGTGERAELLKKAELQDFSGLSREKRKKSLDYVEHLVKRKRTEELGRYVRFAAAAGGSSANYILNEFSWSLRNIREYLAPEQEAAIQAEGIAWNQYALSWANIKQLCRLAEKDLKVICRAMELCSSRYDNVRVLLAAVYLHVKRAGRESGSPAQGIKDFFGKSMFETSGSLENRKAAELLESNLEDSLPGVFAAPGLNEEEKKSLQAYVRRGRPYGEFPPELREILKGKQAEQYLLTLLSSCAFLAWKHSGCCLTFLQIMAALNSKWTLEACKRAAEPSWFEAQLPKLEQTLPLKLDEFAHWYLKNRVDGGLRRMAKQYPECIRTEIEKGSVSTEDYQYLLEQVRIGSSSLYQQLGACIQDKYRNKLVEELTDGMTVGKTETKRYLLGEASLDELWPFVDFWRGDTCYYYDRYLKADMMERDEGQLYRRVVVLQALEMRGGFFVYHYLPHTSGGKAVDISVFEDAVEKLVKLLLEEGLTVQYLADAIEGIYSSCYLEKDKSLLLDAAVKALARRFSSRREEFYTALKTSASVGRDICYRVLDEEWQQEKDRILSGAMDGSKQVRETLILICAEHREWEPEIRAFLASRKAQERELAIRVMRSWGAEQYREELQKALETEKSKKLKELLQNTLGASVPDEAQASAAGQPQTAQELAAEILKGGRKRKTAWACETPFSDVHRKDGSLAAEDYLQALLTAYADMTVPGVNTEANRLAAELEEKELGRYMAELFDKWMEAGAEVKKKWVLYAAAIHGGAEIVPVFWRQIQEWPQHARGALAAEAVKALALNGSSEALLLVDQISRKFKFRQVKAAAAAALDAAAGALGISRAELEDRIVPTLGFGERLERTFDYGARSFHVYLTPALELEIFDGEGKRLKNMPAPGKRDDEKKAADAYAEFKALKKQLKTVAANQKLRLEQALTAERLWNLEQWRTLFVKNPVMHQFAIGLIWGIYEEGALKATFRYMEDGSFNTMDEEEFELPEAGMAGLVHPIELSEEELAAWKEQLSDYEVTQPIEQLERPVYRLTEDEKEKTELTRFGGKLLNGLSLSGRLQGMGWYRGSVQDGGVYTTFYREDERIGVELEFSGSYVGDENDEVTVYGAHFYKAGTVKRGSYVYDTIKKENEYKLGQVSPRYFSEVVLQLTRATASSQEQLAYPECRS